MSDMDVLKFATAVFAIATVLGFLVESSVEYFVGIWFSKFPKLEPYKWLLMYVAAVFGLYVAIHYKVDLIAALMRVFGLAHPDEIHGMFLSGLGIGRGANFIHELWSRFFPKPSARAQG